MLFHQQGKGLTCLQPKLVSQHPVLFVLPAGNTVEHTHDSYYIFVFFIFLQKKNSMYINMLLFTQCMYIVRFRVPINQQS